MDVLRHSIESNTLLELEGTSRPTTRLGLFGLFGPRVDTISYNYNLFLSYSNEVNRIRSSFETLTCKGLAFVTFNSQQTSHYLSQILFNSRPQKFRVRLAPDPLDIYWKNLNIPKTELIFRKLLAVLILIFTIFFGVLVISLFFKELILKNIAGISKNPTENSESSSLPIEDLVLLMATSIFFSTTPFIFTGTSVLQGLTTHSAIEKRTISLHFLFLFFNILMVLTLVASFWDSLIKQLLNGKMDSVRSFAEAMEKNHLFFTRYFILLGLGCFPLQLLHPGPLFYSILCRIFCSSPRGAGNLLAPVFMDYGWLYGTPMFVFVIVSIYSSTSLGVLFVGVVYFVVGYFVVKNNLLYVYTRHYESHGLLWPFVYRHLLSGIILSQLFVLGTCLEKESSQPLLIVPLILLSIYYYFHMRRAFPDDCRHLPADWFYAETSPPPIHFPPPTRQSPVGPIARIAKAARWCFCLIKQELLPPKYDSLLFAPPDPNLSEPDLKKCTCQPPSLILKGILDSSITTYRCPYIYGQLPHLWLPPQGTDNSPYLRRIRSCPCCLTLIDSGVECHQTPLHSSESLSTASIEAIFP
ncbi:hypothetical protein DSO57_1026468 [Entomophthora muscae]|uniref:Uncharacterized protein n=1 Tax=Entomophthora muscae TaxID=34485 RepID=A0ACC2SQW6_9FUNG|nr:hypothetical protein DSO57_1026468 [Entomophthora muscae]